MVELQSTTVYPCLSEAYLTVVFSSYDMTNFGLDLGNTRNHFSVTLEDQINRQSLGKEENVENTA